MNGNVVELLFLEKEKRKKELLIQKKINRKLYGIQAQNYDKETK